MTGVWPSTTAAWRRGPLYAPAQAVALLLSRACTSREEALRLEYHIKRLPRSRKEQALKEFPQCCPWILS